MIQLLMTQKTKELRMRSCLRNLVAALLSQLLGNSLNSAGPPCVIQVSFRPLHQEPNFRTTTALLLRDALFQHGYGNWSGIYRSCVGPSDAGKPDGEY